MTTIDTEDTIAEGLSQAAEAYQNGDIDTAVAHMDSVLDRISAMLAELETMRADVEERLKTCGE